MKKYYMAATHNVVRALDAGNIRFPIEKKELLARVGETEVQIDFDKRSRLSEYCGGITLDRFENKAQFFCALVAAHTAFA
jgi:hypothetical protein